MIRKVSVLVGILVIAYFMVGVVMELPLFGSYKNKQVGDYYLSNGLEETGSANIVNSIVWDYRGYDTLGEETILFSAALGVLLVMRRFSDGRDNTGN